MAITRWDPFRDIEDFSKSMNRMFARTIPSAGEGLMTSPDWAPAVDISETNEEYLLKAELPDVKKEDMKVYVENGVLKLSGEKRSEKEEKGKKYHRIERSYGQFMRSFTLPENVAESNVKAEFKDGVLTVHLMKSAVAKPKAIDVKIA